MRCVRAENLPRGVNPNLSLTGDLLALKLHETDFATLRWRGIPDGLSGRDDGGNMPSMRPRHLCCWLLSQVMRRTVARGLRHVHEQAHPRPPVYEVRQGSGHASFFPDSHPV